MIGFFDKTQFQEQAKKQQIKKVEKPKVAKVFTCEDCGRDKKCKNRIKDIYGQGKKKILIISEYPTAEEDRTGKPGKGKPLDILRRVLEKEDIDMEQDCWKIDAIQCRPSYFGSVKNKEILACSRFTKKAIKELQPDIILLLGSAGFDGLIQPKLKGRSSAPFSSFAGEVIPEPEYKANIGIVYGTEYMLQKAEKDIVWKKEWEKSVRKTVKSGKPLLKDYTKDCVVLMEEGEACEVLEDILKRKPEVVAIDYEATGIKPHAPGHKITTGSISDGKTSWGFPFFESERFLDLWRQIMRDTDIGKLAHNLKYEHQWTKTILGYDVKGWDWDTMLGAHVEENHRKTGLKPQVYAKFGVIGYDDGVAAYMKSGRGGNSKNNMEQAMIDIPDNVCLYCAMDSLLTYKLMEKQLDNFDDDDIRGHDFLRDADEALAQIQQNGMRMDVSLMEKTKNGLHTYLAELKQNLKDSQDVLDWETARGKKFNYASSKDLKNYLFNFKGYLPTKETAKGNPSTDAESLRELSEKNHDTLLNDILEIKRWDKASGTYLAQFEREIVGEYIRPIFTLNNVVTYRSGSNSPNFQNIPKRDKEVKKKLRSFIVPRKGNKLKEYDYGAMEVGAGCFYHKDKTMIKYVTDGLDMHKDSAADLFLKKPEEVDKATERNLVKNAFVFPEFYGSWFKQVAPDLWDRATKESKEWLSKHGIKSFSKFQEHVKEVEDKLWKRFWQFKKWMKGSEKEYRKNGYLKMHTGFTVRYPMVKNEIINYRTQGTAFHCLLYTLTNIQLYHMHEFQNSFIIGQIHDALVFDMHPDDEDRIDYLMWYYGTQKIREDWLWINVPLKLEAEASEADGNWAEMGEEVLIDFSDKEEK